MTISPVQSSDATQKSATTGASSKGLGNYQMFLQLLITELKNQDPTKPADPTQTVSQLATFSSLEQAVKTNDLLTALNTQSTLSQGASLIGRRITSSDGKVSGSVKSITFGDTGLVANLSDGRQIQVGSGVSVA